MANEEQLSILRQGVPVWNKWRDVNPTTSIDLREAKLKEVQLGAANLNLADLRGADLRQSNLSEVNLNGAILREVDLRESNINRGNLSNTDLNVADLRQAVLFRANLTGADLDNANLNSADLREVNLSKSYLYRASLNGVRLDYANLTGASCIETSFVGASINNATFNDANLNGANLIGAQLVGTKLVGTSFISANLYGANLTNADLYHSLLIQANLVQTNIDNAIISESNIYGINVWDLLGEFKEQNQLIVTPEEETAITVDNIKIAQFVYLILTNKELRDVINTLTSKTVLILGRFAIPERKEVLDALRNKLREHDLVPIVFDFDRPADKDFTETIKTLAGISYFVIADVTNPKSSPLELQATVPDYQIPFVPIIQEGESPFAMMVDLQNKYPWVLPTKSYDSIETLMSALKPGIIDPAVEMRNKLRLVKAQEQVTESLRDYVDKTL